MTALLAFSTLFFLGGLIGFMATFFPFAYDLESKDRHIFRVIMAILMVLSSACLILLWP